MNHTDERILKLAACGLSDEQIARKIGRPGDVERVRKAIGRRAVSTPAVKRACHGCGEFAPFQGGVAFFCDACKGSQ